MNKNFLNKICFNEKIDKIKSEDIKEYLKEFLLVKNILIKISLFVLIGIFVLGLSFILRQIFIDNYPNKIIGNTGISFSFLSNVSTAVVYVVQILPSLFMLIFAIFLNEKYLYIGLLVMFFGGLANIIDRALPLDLIVEGGKQFPSHAVVDYIPWFNTKCNLPDIFITLGVIYTIISLVFYIINTFKKSKLEDAKKQETTQ